MIEKRCITPMYSTLSLLSSLRLTVYPILTSPERSHHHKEVRDQAYLVEGTVSLRRQLNRHRLERLVLLPQLPNLLSQHRFDRPHPLSHSINCALQCMHLRTLHTASTLRPQTALSLGLLPQLAMWDTEI
jgi:hypothetical protein